MSVDAIPPGRRDRAQVLAQPAAGRPARGQRIEQGYLAVAPDGVEVRVRRRAGRSTLYGQVGPGAGSAPRRSSQTRDRRFESLWPLTEGRRDRQRSATSCRSCDGLEGRARRLRRARTPGCSSPRSSSLRARGERLASPRPRGSGREVTGGRALREPVACAAGRPAPSDGVARSIRAGLERGLRRRADLGAQRSSASARRSGQRSRAPSGRRTRAGSPGGERGQHRLEAGCRSCAVTLAIAPSITSWRLRRAIMLLPISSRSRAAGSIRTTAAPRSRTLAASARRRAGRRPGAAAGRAARRACAAGGAAASWSG